METLIIASHANLKRLPNNINIGNSNVMIHVKNKIKLVPIDSDSRYKWNDEYICKIYMKRI